MKANDVRSVACEIAKRLARESGIPDAKPNMFMKAAWAEARASKEAPKPLTFFHIEYKQLKGWKKAIIQAATKEEATAFFYIEGDRTLQNEVRDVKPAKKIAASWEVQLRDFRVARLPHEIDLTTDVEIEGTVGGKKAKFKVSDISAASPARKEAVMK